uniref:Interleukin 21 receptor n=1 Tax=Pseudonaja textilis TaxID=8673 RepID=A0A670Y2I4_PSETE
MGGGSGNSLPRFPPASPPRAPGSALTAGHPPPETFHFPRNCGDGGSCSFNLTASNGTHARYACFSEQKLCFALNTFEVSIATTPAQGPSRLPQGCNKTFLFQNHIKPYPPIHLAAAASSAGYTLSWETRYLDQEYHLLSDSLQYELRYRKRGHPWQVRGQRGKPGIDLRSLRLLPQELEPDTKYEFQVRSRPASSYQGTWSDWSPPASLKTTPKGEPPASQPPSSKPAPCLLLANVVYGEGKDCS